MNARASTLYGGSPVADILSMIERHAPLLMKAGGGPISEGCETLVQPPRLSANERDAIVDAYRAGWRADITSDENSALLHSLAHIHGLTYNTICRITREERRALRTYFSKNQR